MRLHRATCCGPRERRFQQFFACSLFFWVCSAMLAVFLVLLGALLWLSRALGLGYRGEAFEALFALIYIVICWVMLRLSILFPAIAVDAPGANWRNAMADTRGYALPIVLVTTGAS